MDETFETLISFWKDVKTFSLELTKFIFKSLHISFLRFEEKKGKIVSSLYKERGRLARRLTHSGMAALTALGVIIAPVIAQEFPGRSVNPWEVSVAPTVLSASTDNPEIDTQFSDKVRDKIYEYTVQDGDTVASIAQKFDVSEDTIRWQNDLVKDKIKVNQILKILPVA